MSTSVLEQQALACDVRVTDDELIVGLADGRRISAPVVWYPLLHKASEAARSNWRLIGDGIGIHWPDIDEDISVEGLLRGRPSVEYRRRGGKEE